MRASSRRPFAVHVRAVQAPQVVHEPLRRRGAEALHASARPSRRRGTRWRLVFRPVVVTSDSGEKVDPAFRAVLDQKESLSGLEVRPPGTGTPRPLHLDLDRGDADRYLVVERSSAVRAEPCFVLVRMSTSAAVQARSLPSPVLRMTVEVEGRAEPRRPLEVTAAAQQGQPCVGSRVRTRARSRDSAEPPMPLALPALLDERAIRLRVEERVELAHRSRR